MEKITIRDWVTQMTFHWSHNQINDGWNVFLALHYFMLYMSFFAFLFPLLFWPAILKVFFESSLCYFPIPSSYNFKYQEAQASGFIHSFMCSTRVQLGLKSSALYYNFPVLGNFSVQWLMYFSALFLSEDRLIVQMFCWWKASEDERWKESLSTTAMAPWTIFTDLFTTIAAKEEQHEDERSLKNARGCSFPHLMSRSESDYGEILKRFSVPSKPLANFKEMYWMYFVVKESPRK